MQIVAEDMVQGLLHVLLVGDNAVINGVLQMRILLLFWG